LRQTIAEKEVRYRHRFAISRSGLVSVCNADIDLIQPEGRDGVSPARERRVEEKKIPSRVSGDTAPRDEAHGSFTGAQPTVNLWPIPTL
jgi:hypothetical protein